jgi:hypothetical protein
MDHCTMQQIALSAPASFLYHHSSPGTPIETRNQLHLKAFWFGSANKAVPDCVWRPAASLIPERANTFSRVYRTAPRPVSFLCI